MSNTAKLPLGAFSRPGQLAAATAAGIQYFEIEAPHDPLNLPSFQHTLQEFRDSGGTILGLCRTFEDQKWDSPAIVEQHAGLGHISLGADRAQKVLELRDTAQALGAKYISMHVGHMGGVHLKTLVKNVVTAASGLADAGLRLHCELGPDTFAEISVFFSALGEQGITNVGINGDTANPTLYHGLDDNKVMALIRQIAEKGWLASTHIKRARALTGAVAQLARKSKKWQGQEVEMDAAFAEAYLRFLLEVGYTGAVVCEYEIHVAGNPDAQTNGLLRSFTAVSAAHRIVFPS